MLSLEEYKYYSRQIIIDEIGKEGQNKLKSSKVLIVGAGGLGCPTLQYLVAAGVGKIGVIDNDKVEMSNLHRQILFSINDIGKYKAEVIKEKLNLLNPNIQITSFPFRLNTENILDLFSDYDLIVDCTDNYPTRFLINDACVQLNKPFVSGSIYRFEGQVAVFNYKNGPTLRCIYPSINQDELNLNCSLSGVIGVLPGIIGAFQANEVLKIILSMGNVLNDKMLIYSAKYNSFDFIKIARNSNFDYSQFIIGEKLLADNYLFECTSNNQEINHISVEDLLIENNLDDYFFLDVREYHEFPVLEGKNTLQIPLSELSERIQEIQTSKNLIVVCQSGIRSQNAIKILQENRINNYCFNLKNGLTQKFIQLWEKKSEKQKTFL